MKFELEKSELVNASERALSGESILTFLSDGHQEEAFFVVDSSSILQNVNEFSDEFPVVKVCHDLAVCNSDQVLEWMLSTVEVTMFSCHNKREIEMALQSVNPKQIAFLTPCKPTSQIKYALSHGVGTVGCGSSAEVEKVHRALLQLDFLAAERMPNLMVSIDVCGLIDDQQQTGRIMELLREASDRGMDVVGVSLFNNSPSALADVVDGDLDVYETIVKKSIAVSTFAFEVGNMLGHPMNKFDIGQYLDKGEGIKGSSAEQQPKAIYDHLRSQFSNFNGRLGIESVEVLGHVSRRLLHRSIGLSVKIIDQLHDRDRDCFVVNESIYGAFQGAFVEVGSSCQPKLIKVGTCPEKEVPRYNTCDIIGNSWTELDTVASGVNIFGGNLASRGDWLLFPNMEVLATNHRHSSLPLYLIPHQGDDKQVLMTGMPRYKSLSHLEL